MKAFLVLASWNRCYMIYKAEGGLNLGARFNSQ